MSVGSRRVSRFSVLFVAVSAAPISISPALGADATLAKVLKAPVGQNFDWGGWYVDSHLGCAVGSSTWSALSLGVAAPALTPNDIELDPGFRQFQWVGEIERRYELWGHPGKIAVTGYLTRGRMGSYHDAIASAQMTGSPANIAAVPQYGSRGGVSMNLEQEITSELGAFVRAGVTNGNIEPYEFADIDRTIAAGLSLSGKQWGRPDDTVGLAGVVNSISSAHQAYLNAGGLGILIGDGMLPHPGSEQIIETYYSLPISFLRLTFDYQFIVNPAYNRDRGPVSVIGTRLHAQF